MVLSSPPTFASLATQLVAYENAFTNALAASVRPDLAETDAAFAQLRVSVARHWPEGSPLVDAVGLSANDLLDALALGQPLSVVFHAHARALFDLRVGLRGAAGWAAGFYLAAE
jgi:hypothetical protein